MVPLVNQEAGGRGIADPEPVAQGPNAWAAAMLVAVNNGTRSNRTSRSAHRLRLGVRPVASAALETHQERAMTMGTASLGESGHLRLGARRLCCFTLGGMRQRPSLHPDVRKRLANKNPS